MWEFFFFDKVGKKPTALLKFYYFTSIFQGILLCPKHFVVVVQKDCLDLITKILITINLYT